MSEEVEELRKVSLSDAEFCEEAYVDANSRDDENNYGD